MHVRQQNEGLMTGFTNLLSGLQDEAGFDVAFHSGTLEGLLLTGCSLN